MKQRSMWFDVLVAFAAFLLLMFSIAAFAAEPVVCAITTATGSSASTASPTTGTCTWGKGATVLVQCTTDTYIDSTTVGVTAPSATSSDQAIDFTNNKDPYIVYLGNSDKVIAVRAVSSAGSCNFMPSLRRKPY
jgi:pectate lyase